jgi:hypothetical protein
MSHAHRSNDAVACVTLIRIGAYKCLCGVPAVRRLTKAPPHETQKNGMLSRASATTLRPMHRYESARKHGSKHYDVRDRFPHLKMRCSRAHIRWDGGRSRSTLAIPQWLRQALHRLAAASLTERNDLHQPIEIGTRRDAGLAPDEISSIPA